MNTLSEYEVALVSTTYSIYNHKESKQYDCSYCLDVMKKRDPKIQEKRHCLELSDKIVTQNPTRDFKVNYRLCPGNYNSSEVIDLMSIYSNFKNGIMPESGGFLDQSAKVVDGINLLYSLDNQELEKQLKENKPKQGSNGRRS